MLDEVALREDALTAKHCTKLHSSHALHGPGIPKIITDIKGLLGGVNWGLCSVGFPSAAMRWQTSTWLGTRCTAACSETQP